MLKDCIGIIAGYRQQKKRIAPASRFPDWDALVRQPLMWVGELDVGKVFDNNMALSEEMGARAVIIWKLSQYFKDEEFESTDIAKIYGQDYGSWVLWPIVTITSWTPFMNH